MKEFKCFYMGFPDYSVKDGSYRDSDATEINFRRYTSLDLKCCTRPLKYVPLHGMLHKAVEISSIGKILYCMAPYSIFQNQSAL